MLPGLSKDEDGKSFIELIPIQQAWLIKFFKGREVRVYSYRSCEAFQRRKGLPGDSSYQYRDDRIEESIP